ncbi:MAG: hypothetical protein CNE98_05780 [Bacteroidetes bacterium MED-G17]|nr:MAG: hypothetical protein CNE98_05780 [Bacteroidetes bacterium MED-G17]
MERGVFFSNLLSTATKQKAERLILGLSIFSFIIHLFLIYALDFGWIKWAHTSSLLKNPISAIYTPFSFILLYEVYLTLYYLPKSFTTYIGKQYEIISLIIIRRLFKDLSNLELSSNWFAIKDDLQFTYDLTASLLLFFLIFLFQRQSQKVGNSLSDLSELSGDVKKFIQLKKKIGFALVPIFLVLAFYTFFGWAMHSFYDSNLYVGFKDINNIFFDEFFTILIVVDVLLLLLSFYHTDEFHKVIRNSGFIISTILIRLSFSVDGLTNTVLIVAAVLFGLFIIAIHNLFETRLSK